MKKIFVFILALLLIFGGSAYSESCPSPDVQYLARLESRYFTLSDFPNNLMPAEVVRVNMYPASFGDKTFVDAYFTPSCVPERIHSVILTDGVHMAQAAFDVQSDTLWLYFYVPDLMRFDSTSGLWLVLIEQVT